MLPAFSENFFDGGGVVVRQGDSIPRGADGNARAGRFAESCGAGAGVHQKTVAVPVVAADKFYNFVASSEAARNSQGAHRRLGAGIYHAQNFNAGIKFLHEFSQPRFKLSGRAVAGAAFDGFFQRSHNFFVRVTENHWSPRANVVNVFVAVNVENAAAQRAGDKRRVSSNA